MAKIIRPRGDIKSNWEAKNPILNIREMGIEWETIIGDGTVKIKFGDGITHWNDLDYAVIPQVSGILYNTKSQWESENPVLNAKEMGIEWADTIGNGPVRVKFGNGLTPWNELEYGITEDITDKAVSSFTVPSESEENPALSEGDSLSEIAGKLDKQHKYANAKSGYERLDALAATLEGLEQQDFVGILDYLNQRKLDKADVYNGTDSSSQALAASANSVRLVKELADNNAQGISTLNSNLTTLEIPAALSLTSEALINNYYDTVSNSLSNNTHYRRLVSHGVGHTVLSGGVIYLEGTRVNDNYEWQIARSYSDRNFYRDKIAGTWRAWRKLITTSDLRCGTITTGNLTANAITTMRVNFGGELTRKPFVLAYMQNSATDSNNYYWVVNVIDITTIGFNVAIKNTLNQTVGLNSTRCVKWIAMAQ